MASSFYASAFDEYSKTVKTVATGPVADTRFTANISLNETLQTSCKWNVIYFDITTEVGKSAYSLALSAKISGTPLSRLSYEKSGEYCFLTFIEIG